MLKWIRQSNLFECVWLTLVSTTLTALISLAGIVASDLSVSTIEKWMVWLSVPWFLFWYVFCKVTHNIKLVVK